MNSLLESNYEVYEEDFELEEKGPENIISFYNEVEPIIKQCIKNYFCDKFLHDGRDISTEILELSFYSSLVFNTSVSDGVLKGYFLMEDNNFLLENQEDQNSIGGEIKYMINLIRNIQRKIPQEFVGGMILMHLELVEGIEIW